MIQGLVYLILCTLCLVPYFIVLKVCLAWEKSVFLGYDLGEDVCKVLCLQNYGASRDYGHSQLDIVLLDAGVYGIGRFVFFLRDLKGKKPFKFFVKLKKCKAFDKV